MTNANRHAAGDKCEFSEVERSRIALRPYAARKSGYMQKPILDQFDRRYQRSLARQWHRQFDPPGHGIAVQRYAHWPPIQNGRRIERGRYPRPQRGGRDTSACPHGGPQHVIRLSPQEALVNLERKALAKPPASESSERGERSEIQFSNGRAEQVGM